MMEDKFLFMADAQALTTQATVDSTNVLDLTKDGDMMGKQPWWVVRVNTLFTSEGSATLAASLHTASVSSFEQIGQMALAATALSALTAGAVLVKMPIPFGVKRYVKTVFTVGAAAMTAGKIDSFITFEPENY